MVAGIVSIGGGFLLAGRTRGESVLTGFSVGVPLVLFGLNSMVNNVKMPWSDALLPPETTILQAGKMNLKPLR